MRPPSSSTPSGPEVTADENDTGASRWSPPKPAESKASAVVEQPNDANDGLAFAVGAQIANRYRVVRFIARGAMGEVYEAEDFELGGRVALKTLRGERVRDAHKLERFRREIAVSRRVTHRNVGRVFDVGFHDGAGGLAPTMFLTMELLTGESLAGHLARTGPMRPEEAFAVAEQMASALTAAHDAGIVHRDFKPANVLVVADRGGNGVARAVVTDFGLARALDDGGDHVHLTADGAMLGSPAYMAPEQVEGKPATAASDIYAFGIVLFEMVTGQRPFVASTVIATATMRLSVKPAVPSDLRPGLPPVWDAVILRCLERTPEDRFSSMGDVIRALREPVSAVSQSDAGRTLAPRPRARRLLAVGAIAVLSVGVAIGFRARSSRISLPGVSALESSSSKLSTVARPNGEMRRAMAVLGFDGLGPTGTSDWVASALVQLVDAELSGGQRLRTITRDRVAQARRDLRLTSADASSGDVLAQLRQNLGVDLVAFGTFLKQTEARGATIRVQVIVKEAATGDTVASVNELGSEADLFDIVARAGVKLRERLGLGVLSPEERVAVGSALPANEDAARLFAEGLVAQERYRNVEARELLARSVAAAPDFALGYSVLARATEALGRDEDAKALAKKAVDLASSLSREDRLTLEGQYYIAIKDWPHAVVAFQTLYNFFPDNVDYGVRLAQAQMKGGSGDAALSTIAELRALPPSIGDDPRIDIEEARAAHGLSRYDLCLAAAQRAIEKGKARRNWSLVGKAGYYAGAALWNLGRSDEAVASYTSARELSRDAGDLLNVALIQQALAGSYAASGQLALARTEIEGAHAALTSMGNAYFAASALERLGGLDADVGDLPRARTRMETAIVQYRAAGSKHALSTGLTALGGVRLLEGDLASSRALCDEALQISQSIRRKNAEVDAHLCLATLAVKAGDTRDARAEQDRALELARLASNKSAIARALDAVGESQRNAGDVAGARRSLDAALAYKNELHELLGAASTRTGLARVALSEHSAEEAERQSGAAEEVLAAAGAKTARARAACVRVEALVAMGRNEDAHRALEIVISGARGSTDLELSLLSSTLGAFVRASRGEPAGLGALMSARDRARAAGFADVAADATRLLAIVTNEPGARPGADGR